jgi:hypothetical protein
MPPQCIGQGITRAARRVIAGPRISMWQYDYADSKARSHQRTLHEGVPNSATRGRLSRITEKPPLGHKPEQVRAEAILSAK